MKAKQLTTIFGATLLLLPALLAQGLPPSANSALRLVRQGRFGDALPLVEAELVKAPKNVALLHLRAVCKGKLGRHDEAIADANAALAIDPRHADSYGERAYNLFLLGKVDQSLADFDKSIELNPKNPMVHGERGDVLLAQKRYREAIAAFDAAIRLAPKWPNPHSQRGRAASNLADFDAARTSFARAVELAPDDLYSVFQLASAQFDCRLDDDALETAQKLVDLRGDGFSIAIRGRLAWQVDRHDLAKKELTRAMQDGEGHQRLDARLSLGTLLLSLGDAKAALDAMPFDPALERDAELSPWLSLTRWCSRSAAGMRGEADAKLAEELDACTHESDEVRTFADLLLGKGSVAEFEAATRERAAPSCPALFFAGWRAFVDGEMDRSDALLLQCVATGQKYYQQWQAARTILMQRHGAEAFVVSPGATFRKEEIDGRERLVVEQVAGDPPGAAKWQGLEVGDVVLRVSDAPYDAAAIEGFWGTRRVGYDVHLTIRRGDAESVVMLPLGWQRR